MQSVPDRLKAGEVLVSDGAWGTELARRGLPAGTAPEYLNLERPEAVLDVAAAYVLAGADIILTNSFGGSPAKLAKAQLGRQVAEVNRRAAELSREAAGDKAMVFGSVGPTGEFLQPLGEMSEQDMIAGFAEQIAALVEGGVHGIAIETMSDLGEAKAAVTAAREVGDLTVVACTTYQKGPKGYASMMGVTPDLAAGTLAEIGADIIGVNCGVGVEDVVEIVRAMRAATDKPIWAKANAGMPELVDGRTVFRASPDDMACYVPGLVRAGASVVGGCCGTTPDHIRAMAAARDALG